MADEKTTPTPKVSRTDTMHSTPEMPDRSKEAAKSDAKADEKKADADRSKVNPSTTTMGEASHRVIKTENVGTLVEDLPSAEDAARDKPRTAKSDPLAAQPGENIGDSEKKKK